MTKGSGLPSQATVITSGAVSTRATTRNIHAAANLPSTAWVTVTGCVKRNSMVPALRSSAQRRIPTAGTKKMYSRSRLSKKALRSACRISKKRPLIVRNPARTRNTTRIT